MVYLEVIKISVAFIIFCTVAYGCKVLKKITGSLYNNLPKLDDEEEQARW